MSNLPLVDTNPIVISLASDGIPNILTVRGTDESSLLEAGQFVSQIQNKELDGLTVEQILERAESFSIEPLEPGAIFPDATIVDAVRVVDGILPGRSSQIMSQERINGFLNRIEFATLPLSVRVFDDSDNVFVIDPDNFINFPGGFIMLEGNDNVTGSDRFDNIGTNAGSDTVNAGDGADLVRGGRGNDILNGGSGNDILHGNKGDDLINGNADRDFLRGGQGSDLLNGGDGDDWLVGDRQQDTLTGGTGVDTFLLRVDVDTSVDSGVVDVITDFSIVDGDRISVIGDVPALSLTTSGADVLIKTDSNTFIGKVLNSTESDVLPALNIVAVTDLAMTIG